MKVPGGARSLGESLEVKGCKELRDLDNSMMTQLQKEGSIFSSDEERKNLKAIGSVEITGKNTSIN